MNKNWKNNKIQFPRLIAELEAVGAFTDEHTICGLCNSMDLTREEIFEIVERASNEWDKIVAKT